VEKDLTVLKDKLARACRMLEMVGLIDFSGHISGRIPGGETFFIHPLELSRAEVTPDDMVEVTLAGKQASGKMEAPHEVPIHAAVYQARPDVNFVIHSHPHYTILPSIAGRELIPVCSHGGFLGAKIPVYPDSKKITNIEQARQMVGVLGKARAVILRGHGAVLAESTVEGVFIAALYLEENAKVFVEACMLGEPIPLSPDELRPTLPQESIRKIWSYFIEKGRKAGIFWDS
jgi:L-ribulose-5-phosphate 4-epimerase